MIEDGYRPTRAAAMTSAASGVMRDHGVLRTSSEHGHGPPRRPRTRSQCAVKAPGFGPKGVLFVLPFWSSRKLKDIGGNVLPS